MKEVRTDHGYYICAVCAEEQKLTTKYPNGGNTSTMIPCDWCGKENSSCTPIVDFRESGDESWD